MSGEDRKKEKINNKKFGTPNILFIILIITASVLFIISYNLKHKPYREKTNKRSIELEEMQNKSFNGQSDFKKNVDVSDKVNKKEESQFDISLFEVDDLKNKTRFKENVDKIKYILLSYDFNILVNKRKLNEIDWESLDEILLFNDHTSITNVLDVNLNSGFEKLKRYIKSAILFKLSDIERNNVTPGELIEELNQNGALVVVPEGEDIKEYLKKYALSKLTQIKVDSTYLSIDQYYEDMASLIVLKITDEVLYDKIKREELIPIEKFEESEKRYNKISKIL